MFDFIGRGKRLRAVRPKLVEAIAVGDPELALEVIEPLRRKDGEIHRLLRQLIEAGNMERAVKLLEAQGG